MLRELAYVIEYQAMSLTHNQFPVRRSHSPHTYVLHSGASVVRLYTFKSSRDLYPILALFTRWFEDESHIMEERATATSLWLLIA